MIKSDRRFLPYYDIPFQSGDDEIILKMHRTGNHKKYALTFRQLDEILEPQRFWRTDSAGGQFRYFMEYEYQSDVRDLCSVCSLAYNQACKVRKCPLILVEVMN